MCGKRTRILRTMDSNNRIRLVGVSLFVELWPVSPYLSLGQCNVMSLYEKSVKKDGPGPVMVSSSLCPAVHISGSLNMYSRAMGITDHYWPRAIFFSFFFFLFPSLSPLAFFPRYPPFSLGCYCILFFPSDVTGFLIVSICVECIVSIPE